MIGVLIVFLVGAFIIYVCYQNDINNPWDIEEED